jgi:FtsH-binding integral membrane protein
MPAYAVAAPAISGPSEDRHGFLLKTALWTLAGLIFSGGVGVLSTLSLAPLIARTRFIGGGVVVLVTFVIAHWLCRKMVYGGAKIPGFILACAAEGAALGVLVLSTIAQLGLKHGTALVIEALGITAATALGMVVYAWFSKGELKFVGAFLSMMSFPMLLVMILGVFVPIGGPIGIAIAAAFVLFSAGSVLYRLNYVVSQLDTGMHIEGAYEVCMSILVLLWNVIVLLRRLQR